MEGESEDQAATDQTSATKTKSIFIAQNVASLQELGENQLSSLEPKMYWKNVSPVLHLTALSGNKLCDLKGSLSCLVNHQGRLWLEGSFYCRDELSVLVF